ncbi:phage portal protein [Aerococcus viridans]|uniref:phage portal protein n=1 Tax=Aerococcus viridans TaxID=1377 RepID=UPI002DB68F0C|nr:phage portal protein [Aerococcus viridans]MEB7388712.1 phage portal protein [Aerococcus viridans]
MVFVYSREKEITPEVVNDFIKQHEALLPRYEELEILYKSQAPILFQEDKDEYKPDNRIVVNFAKYAVDTFNGFFIGIPIKIQHDDDGITEVVNDFINRQHLDDVIAEASKMASIYGNSFVYAYQNELSETCVVQSSPKDMFVVYDDTISRMPLFAVRYYLDDEEVLTGQLFTDAVEISFKRDGDGIVFEDEVEHFYGLVPIIEFIENEEHQGLIEPIETLINAYNKAISEKANDVDYFADAYLSIIGADIGDGMNSIRDNRIINLFSTNGEIDAQKIKIEFLDKPDGDTSQENLLNRIERLIYQTSMVANINDESFGNASGVALKMKLQPMTNLAIMKERKFTKGLSQLFKLFFALPTNVPPAKKDEWVGLKYTFTRNIPENIADEASTAVQLQGIVSKETQLSTLSFVDNAAEEIKRMEAETEQESSDGYNTDENGDFIVDESGE